MAVRRRLALALLVTYLAAGAFLVFAPSPVVAIVAVDAAYRFLQSLGGPHWPGWLTPSTVAFAANVALFVPLTLLGSVLLDRGRVLSWVLAGLAVSSLVELTQLALLPQRSATWYDLLANTVGAGLGALLAVPLRVRRRARRTRRP